MRNYDSELKDCWERAIYAFGTAEVFVVRARKYRLYLNSISCLGIVVPLMLGGAIVTYGASVPFLKEMTLIASSMALCQLFLSAISVIYGWPNALEYALDSSIGNKAISEKFKQLGSLANNPPNDFEVRYRELLATDDARRHQDGKAAVSDKELRRGHRAALRQFGRACSGCGAVPKNMESTDCDICGRFKWKRK